MNRQGRSAGSAPDLYPQVGKTLKFPPPFEEDEGGVPQRLRCAVRIGAAGKRRRGGNFLQGWMELFPIPCHLQLLKL